MSTSTIYCEAYYLPGTRLDGDYLVYQGVLQPNPFVSNLRSNILTAKATSAGPGFKYTVDLTIVDPSGVLKASRTRVLPTDGPMASTNYSDGTYNYSVYCKVQ
jgi:hypothetical protein